MVDIQSAMAENRREKKER